MEQYDQSRQAPQQEDPEQALRRQVFEDYMAMPPEVQEKLRRKVKAKTKAIKNWSPEQFEALVALSLPQSPAQGMLTAAGKDDSPGVIKKFALNVGLPVAGAMLGGAAGGLAGRLIGGYGARAAGLGEQGILMAQAALKAPGMVGGAMHGFGAGGNKAGDVNRKWANEERVTNRARQAIEREGLNR